jgi:hypothetical protein
MAGYIAPYAGTTYVAEAILYRSQKLQSHDRSDKRGTTSTTCSCDTLSGPDELTVIGQDVRYLIFNYDTKEGVAVFSAATEIRLLPTAAPAALHYVLSSN